MVHSLGTSIIISGINKAGTRLCWALIGSLKCGLVVVQVSLTLLLQGWIMYFTYLYWPKASALLNPWIPCPRYSINDKTMAGLFIFKGFFNAINNSSFIWRGETYTRQSTWVSLYPYRRTELCLCLFSSWPTASSSLSWCEAKQGDKPSVLVARFSCHSQYPRHTPTTNTHSAAHRLRNTFVFFNTMLSLIRVVMWTKAAVLSATADLWVLKFRQETS